MKIYGLQGAMTGKLGNTVMAVRNGVQLARQYQPIVQDAKSVAQVEQRSKFKLMSQLAEIFDDVIAFRRHGMVSSRNQFIGKNIGSATINEGRAEFDIDAMDVTGGVLYLPTISLTSGGTGATEGLTAVLGAAATDIDRVVYAYYSVEGEEFRFLGMNIVNAADSVDHLFSNTLLTPIVIGKRYVVVGYGVRDNTDAARVMYENYEVPTLYVAQLAYNRSLTEADVTLTETRVATHTRAAGAKEVEIAEVAKSKKS